MEGFYMNQGNGSLLISSAEGGSPVANLSANSTIATTVSSIGELMVSDSSATSALPSSDREPAAKKQKIICRA